MGYNSEFPHVEANKLNLDWLLAQYSTFNKRIKEILNHFDESVEAMERDIAAYKEDTTNQINSFKEEINGEIADLHSDFNEFTTTINNNFNELSEEITTQISTLTTTLEDEIDESVTYINNRLDYITNNMVEYVGVHMSEWQIEASSVKFTVDNNTVGSATCNKTWAEWLQLFNSQDLGSIALLLDTPNNSNMTLNIIQANQGLLYLRAEKPIYDASSVRLLGKFIWTIRFNNDGAFFLRHFEPNPITYGINAESTTINIDTNIPTTSINSISIIGVEKTTTSTAGGATRYTHTKDDSLGVSIMTNPPSQSNAYMTITNATVNDLIRVTLVCYAAETLA